MGRAAPLVPSDGPAGSLVLVGFMGAGKTTVGRALADRLGWRFVDADAALERRCGRTIRSFFEADEEAEFRALEGEVVQDLVASPESLVLATGGGWAADPARVRGLPAAARAIWLRVSPEVAVRRASGEAPSDDPAGRRPTRPLLAVDDPLSAARALLDDREAGYAAAPVWIETDGRQPGEIVAEILDRIGGAGPTRDGAPER